MAVCGLNLLSVLMLIAEIGVDLSCGPNAKAFCSWLGLCPGLKIRGGRVLSRRTRKVVNRASVIWRVAALPIGQTDSWLGRFYRRKKAHFGGSQSNRRHGPQTGLCGLSSLAKSRRLRAAGRG